MLNWYDERPLGGIQGAFFLLERTNEKRNQTCNLIPLIICRVVNGFLENRPNGHEYRTPLIPIKGKLVSLYVIISK